jgi:hypothetical protein
MNGNDLLMYSQMKQRQASLLSEAADHRLARVQAQARRSRTAQRSDTTTVAAPIDANRGGLVNHGRTSPTRTLTVDTQGRGWTTSQRAGPADVGSAGLGSAGLRRLAARVGASLVVVGQRLERMDRC